MVHTIQSSIASWAESQAGSGLPAEALRTVYQIQADLIMKHNGKPLYNDRTDSDAHMGSISISSAPIVEIQYELIPSSE